MALTKAQYELIARVNGIEQANASAVQSGGVSDEISPGTVVADPITGTLHISFDSPDDFYNDSPDPSPPPPIIGGGGTVVPLPSSSMVPIAPVLPAGGGPLFIDGVNNPEVAAYLEDGGSSGAGIGGTIQAGIGTALVGAGSLTAALAVLRVAMRGATRVTVAHWNALPGWAKGLLATAGIVIGAEVAGDLPVPGNPFQDAIPFIGIPGVGGGPGFPDLSGVLGVQVVGSWNANGVTFYRLSDGKLAVQNKHGRWKVWRPKKPIVLYAAGASDIPTMLRADNALNKQSKKISKMLARRAPRTRRTTTKSPEGSSTTVTQVK